ncbi:hypothetical protein D3C85_754190 [compost metagenome]
MALGVQKDDGAVAEQVEVALHLDEIVVARGVEVLHHVGGALEFLGPPGGAQFGLLHHVLGLGEHLDVAGVVQVEVGIHHVLHVADVKAGGLELAVDDLVAALDGIERAAQALAPVIGAVAVGGRLVHAGIEQHQAARVLYHVGGDRNLDLGAHVHHCGHEALVQFDLAYRQLHQFDVRRRIGGLRPSTRHDRQRGGQRFPDLAHCCLLGPTWKTAARRQRPIGKRPVYPGFTSRQVFSVRGSLAAGHARTRNPKRHLTAVFSVAHSDSGGVDCQLRIY